MSSDFLKIVPESCSCCYVHISGFRKEWWTDPKTGEKKLIDSPEVKIESKPSGLATGHEAPWSRRVVYISRLSETAVMWCRSLKGRWYNIKRAARGYGADEFTFYTGKDLEQLIAALQEARKEIFD